MNIERQCKEIYYLNWLIKQQDEADEDIKDGYNVDIGNSKNWFRQHDIRIMLKEGKYVIVVDKNTIEDLTRLLMITLTEFHQDLDKVIDAANNTKQKLEDPMYVVNSTMKSAKTYSKVYELRKMVSVLTC